MVRFINLVVIIIVLIATQIFPQTTPVEGLRDNTPDVHAFINARIVQSPGKVIPKGTVIIRDGLIEAVGENIAPPPDARVWDYSGKTIYPGLIESYSPVGSKKEKGKIGEEGEEDQSTGQESDELGKGASHWNVKVHPQLKAIESYQPDKKRLEEYRKLGFTSAVVVPDDGIFRGTGSLVSLGDEKLNESLISDDIAQYMAFQTRGNYRENQPYPGSLMGCIALIRQTFLDAQWYGTALQAYQLNPSSQTRPEQNAALEALSPVTNHQQKIVWETGYGFNILRALKIAKEFELQPIIRGSGDEYIILDELKKANAQLILPVDFPQKLNVETPEEALRVSLAELQHWDLAPENPGRMQKGGITFALTTAELEKAEDFPSRLRDAIQRGLNKDAALAALTTTPAKLFGVGDKLGSIEKGKLAHLLVANGDLFDEETKVLDVWIDGERFEITKQPLVDLSGVWQVGFDFAADREWEGMLEIVGEPGKLKAKLIQGNTKISVDEISLDWKRLTVTFAGDTISYPGVIRLTGIVESKKITGGGKLPNGTDFNWTGKWVGPSEEKEKKPAPEALRKTIAEIVYPFGAFGRKQLPELTQTILIRNATIWTSSERGVLENADMLVTAGKISKIGSNLSSPSGAAIIDAEGKHVTAGLIDCHSHSGISGGVNEGTQAVTAEVRIEDVINSYSIDFYRELAGGLTAANLLHGSANPIGGQNAVVKLRWGMLPEAMRIATAPPGIKFALGENVKQSNWGDEFTTRYPQTRMGVEQIMRDRFKAALDYEKEWNDYNASKNKKGMIPPRRDLELDALLEVLRGERLVHCHSYRQDEILMLIRLAEEFGFTIRTFQHILEGYKVADAMAAHGAGGSAFSDWWAYKFEVYDAIPYNGALMHDAGVLVSYNSDSDELARRLNTEAAKAVKYGGLSEEEALDFVTINPAIQLGIDDRTGSLEPGKDADFVIWSGSPLSTYSICEQTWIEGRKYFDRDEDLRMRTDNDRQRNALIQKYLTYKKDENQESKKSNSAYSPNNPSWRYEDEDYSCSDH
jgi:imidazolonepropionase-like amidohydrolase